MKNKTITGLDIQECKILKHIVIIGDKHYGEAVIGNIYYKRNFTDEYNLKKQQLEDEKNENSLDKLLNEYPKQKNYPKDRFDEIILDGIKERYPKSKLRNELIIFNVDLEKLEILKNKNKISGKIYFTPKMKDYSNIYQFVGKTFKSPEIEITIYSDFGNEIMEGQTFISRYFVDEEDVLDKLNGIEFE